MQRLVIQCRSAVICEIIVHVLVIVQKKSIDLLHPNRSEVVTRMETQPFIQQIVFAWDCAVCSA